MTDEEKEAIDELTEEINKPLEVPEDKFNTFILYNIESIKTILNLIEKQSKEIEELKQNIHLKEVYVLKTNDYIKGTNVEDELCNKKWKDKIKSKIEELEKMDIYEFETINVIEVLKSLLRKD